MNLYRFRSNYDRLHQETSDFLLGGLLRLSNFSELNDVFEGRPAPSILRTTEDGEKMRRVIITLVQFAIDNMLKPDPMEVSNIILAEEGAVVDKYQGDPTKLVDTMRFRLRSASFTSNVDSDLMWAHYANGHQGWCFEYERTRCFSRFSRDFLCEVRYSTDRPKLRIVDCLPFLVLARMLQASSAANLPRFQTELNLAVLGQSLENHGFYETLKTITLSKSESWRYEAEYRMVDYVSQSGFLKVNSLVMKGIIFGYRADNAIIDEFKRSFGDVLTIKKMTLDDEHYILRPIAV